VAKNLPQRHKDAKEREAIPLDFNVKSEEGVLNLPANHYFSPQSNIYEKSSEIHRAGDAIANCHHHFDPHLI
jgi:hypothetical protein